VERGPDLFVNLGLECGLQGFVGIVCAEKIGVTDEEALFVVVRIDEPASDAVGAVAADFTRVRMEDVHTVDLHPDLVE